jgi:succinate-semialdehyde dehydrogenase/glutarate-semialdehyde dehydrogenase
MAIQTVNPFTNKVVRSFEVTDKAVDGCTIICKTFQFMEPAQILHKVAALMREKKNI